MKKPSDDLFRIIRSMTPSEKRYFKIHFASEGSVLTDLFDYLNAQEEYHEESAKRYFREQGNPNFKVYKLQLQKLLLQSLTSFHSKKSVLSKIRLGLEEVDVLAGKQLYDLAMNRLSKIKKLCEKYEQYTYLIEVAGKDYFLNHLAMDKPGLSNHPSYAIIEKSLGHLSRHNKLSHLSNELMDLIRKVEEEGLEEGQQEELEQMLETPLFQDPPEASTAEKLSSNVAKTYILKLLGDQRIQGELRRENVAFFREKEHLKESMPMRFLAVLRNYLNHSLEVEDYDEVKKLLKEGKAFAKKHKQTQHHLTYFYYAELDMYYRRCHLEQLLDKAPQVLEHLKHNQIERERIAFLIYSMIYMTHLILGQYKEAVSLLDKMREAKPEVRQLYKGLIFLFEWMGFFDAGEEYMAGNLLESYQRRNEFKELEDDSFFSDLLKLLKGLLVKPSERRQLAEQFLWNLDDFEQKGMMMLFRHYRLESWLQALSQGMTISEAYRKM